MNKAMVLAQLYLLYVMAEVQGKEAIFIKSLAKVFAISFQQLNNNQ